MKTLLGYPVIEIEMPEAEEMMADIQFGPPLIPAAKDCYVTLGNDIGGYFIPRGFAEYLLENKLVPEDWQIREG